MGMQVSIQEYAKIRGKNERTVRRWVIDGLPVIKAKKRGEAHKLDTETAIEWELGAFQEKMQAKFQSFDGEQEQARLTHAKANIAEMEEAEKRGDLLPAKGVTEMMAAMVVSAKTRMLGMRANLIREFPEIDPAVLDVVDEVCRESLTELSNEQLPKSITTDVE